MNFQGLLARRKQDEEKFSFVKRVNITLNNFIRKLTVG
jgi:hypothetical protein